MQCPGTSQFLGSWDQRCLANGVLNNTYRANLQIIGPYKQGRQALIC